MLRHLTLVSLGITGGVAALIIAIAAFRVPSPRTLLLLTSFSGVSSAYAAAHYIDRIRHQRYISKRELYEAMGRLEERYALTLDKQAYLVAMNELRGELNDVQR